MDQDVIKFLKIFTEIELSEISKLEKLEGEDINEAKIIRANSITELTHGKEKCDSVYSAAKGVMSNNLGNEDLPRKNVKIRDIKNGIEIYKLFCFENILCKSNSDARRLIKQGAARINGKKIIDYNYLVSDKDLLQNNTIQLSIGKKKYALIKIIS